MYADVGAGCPIKVLLQELRARKNWTLPSVGFITEQTIAGAITTGTHGSGRHSLSHYVLSVRLARYDPERGQAVIEEIHSGDELLAARCSLGCLGVILSVRMQCRSAYNVEEHFSEYETLESLLAKEPTFPLQQFYLVPWRWTYFAQHRKETSGPSSSLLPLYQWYRYLILDWGMHLLIFLCIHVLKSRTVLQSVFRWILPSFVVRQWCVTGPSNQQLVMEHELFRHVEIELFVQKPQLAKALDFLRQVLIVASRKPNERPSGTGALTIGSELVDDQAKEIGYYCHHYPICVRKVLSDATLLSMATPLDTSSPLPTSDNGSDGSWYSITLTNYHRGESRVTFERLARYLAREMAQRFSARPHWGKLCPLDPAELRALYPAFETFARIRDRFDPEHIFSNPWIDRLFDDRHSCQNVISRRYE